MHIEELSELGHRDLVAGLVTLEGKKAFILTLYLYITKDVIAEHLVKVIEYCKKRRFAILLGIDSNAQSGIWGHSNNKRGYIIQEGLEIQNKGKEYTYESSTGKSIIDLTLP